MKVCQLALVAAAIFAAANAFAADGRPSNATLAAMGLSGLNVISDSDSLAIRGFGYNGANAYGQSFAVVASHGAAAGSTNGYDAKGKKKASGANLSFAAVETKKGGSHGGGGGDYGPLYSQGGNNGGHGGDCYDDCGHGGYKPKSIKVFAIAGGSSFGSIK